MSLKSAATEESISFFFGFIFKVWCMPTEEAKSAAFPFCVDESEASVASVISLDKGKERGYVHREDAYVGALLLFYLSLTFSSTNFAVKLAVINHLNFL